MEELGKVFIYLSGDDDFNSLEPLIRYATLDGKIPYQTYRDVDRGLIIYHQLKEMVASENGLLLLTSIDSIGENKISIYKELLWLKEHNVQVVFSDYPSTHIFHNKQLNEMALDILIDVYKSFLENKTFNIKFSQEQDVGRKKKTFPDNWCSLYEKWENSEITAKEFMEQTNLKKGTFYHMVNDYRDILKANYYENKIG